MTLGDSCNAAVWSILLTHEIKRVCGSTFQMRASCWQPYDVNAVMARLMSEKRALADKPMLACEAARLFGMLRDMGDGIGEEAMWAQLEEWNPVEEQRNER